MAMANAGGEQTARRSSRPPRGRRSVLGSAPPLARRTGAVAEEASLHARSDLAREFNDVDDERSSALRLASKLAARDTELDVAIELLRGALAGRDDPKWRHVLARWLERLGDPAGAASELHPLVDERTPKEAASLLVRIGVLHARAGDMEGAHRALTEAAALDESDALPLELLGAIAPLPEDESESIAPRAADAYLCAARRRAAAGDAEAELEDLLRAFEIDPSSTHAAVALSSAFVSRGRAAAADEILRRHAFALSSRGSTEQAAQVHRERRGAALARSDFSVALGAALDDGLDAVFTGSDADVLDDLLLKAGALELLALRLEIRAELQPDRGTARAWADIGRLYAGRLAAPDRAARAYAHAVARDATNEENVALLRGLTGKDGEAWTVEALIRATLGDAGGGEMASEIAGTPWANSVAWMAAATAGDRATRARAMAAYAPSCAFAAVLGAVAAEELSRVGDGASARAVAEQAMRANPEDARALRVMSLLVSTTEGRVAATAIEHAVVAAGPTSDACARLAQVYARMDDATTALAWTRRLVALRPGDASVVDLLLDRTSRADDAEAMTSVLSWFIAQPEPARAAAERIAPVLAALAVRDPSRAVEMATRALDVLGPRHAILREAVSSIATIANAPRLRATLVERWIAAGVPAAEQRPRLVTLVSDYEAAGDIAGELSACVRAARAGADLTLLRDGIEKLAFCNKTPDMELAWLEVCAELAVAQGRTDDAIASLRELGAALWDMAGDRSRALATWLRAAALDSSIGYRTLRMDLSAFADAEYAANCLAELVDRESDPGRSGILAHEASCAALEIGELSRALSLAQMALERHPGRVEAIETAEKACSGLGSAPEMSALYDQVARGARGRFGRRAAHHRAARYFESASIPMLALKHAAQAFIALPSESTTLRLLARTAARAQKGSMAARTVEHVADFSRSRAVRARWLVLAAELAAHDLEGNHQRFELLIKAMIAAPSTATIAGLASVTRDLIALGPEDAHALALRLERASDSLVTKLEGPEGARIAVAFAKSALDVFGDAPWAWRAIAHASDVDADIDEYADLIGFAPALAQAEDAARALARVMAMCDKPYANVGHALLRLAGTIAKALGDDAARARAFVMAVEKESDSDEIISEADEAVLAYSDPSLSERFSKSVDASRRSAALRAIAKKLTEAGELEAAAIKLERVHDIAPNDAEADVAIEALLVSRANHEELAAHLKRRAERLVGEANAETRRAVRLRRVAVLEQRLDRLEDAAAELEQVLVESPGHASALHWLADLHERIGQPAVHKLADERLSGGESETAEKLLFEALGHGSLAAADTLDAMFASDPSRIASLVKVRRHAVDLDPGNLDRLALLRDAAMGDQNVNFARAIDHVIRAFDGKTGPLPPPPLEAQSVQPGMLAMLTHRPRECASEAFGVVWENAPSLFVKTLADYTVSGVERVVPGPDLALSRLYEIALRLLDVPRFALFHREPEAPHDPPRLTVMLCSSPSALLVANAREDSLALRWELGAALASVTPDNALLLGLPETEARALFDVLMTAFGPPGRSIDRDRAKLTQSLWSALPPRAQRRLIELLASDGDDRAPFDLVVEHARQSGRRVGMFLTGDFGHAARAVITEQRGNVEDLSRPGGLARLCAAMPALADLFRLAVRPEYADARWRVSTSIV
ncbi:MAG: hypothetical protein FWD69_11270 [Polyangiaceae bacterium]|nr:hypothetical protein [Polyangiaceae bacterium]